jgi:hypothetical protein
MGIGTDSAWEKWGSRDPYYGVVSFEEFRKDHINDNKERFFYTGNQEIERVLAAAARNRMGSCSQTDHLSARIS